MKRFRNARPLVALLLVLTSVASGCSTEASKAYGFNQWMRDVRADSVSWAPEPGASLLVFVRPKDTLYVYQTGLFHILAGDPELVGLLPAGARIRYQTQPGKHVFMSAGYGSTTEFLNAELLPDKTYYVLINTSTTGWGTWRNVFKPVSSLDTSPTGLQEILKPTRVVEKAPDAEGWARGHMSDLRRRRAHYGEASFRMRTPRLLEHEGW